MNISDLALPPWGFYVAVGLAGVVLAFGAFTALRLVRRKPAGRVGEDGRASRGDLLAAAIATAVSAEGMWTTFEALNMPVWLRVVSFAFLEVNVIQCARRARRTMQRKLAEIAAGERWGKASSGIDGIAMWVLTCLSALLSAAHEVTSNEPGHQPNAAVILVRLVAPLVAAWGWERNMALERHARGLGSGIHWRITPERIAVRLGIAEPSERTTPQVDARRRIARAAQAGKRLRTLQAVGAKERKILRAQKRLDRAMQEAHEYAGLGRDADLQAELLAEAGALYNASAFADLDVPAWWDPKPAAPTLTEEEHGLLAEVPAASDRLVQAVRAYRERARYGVPPGRPAGTTSTIPTTRPTTPAADPSAVVDDGAENAHPNQDPNHDDQANHAGQEPLPDLATIVRSATARGWSERKIAEAYSIKRYTVRTILGRPTSTSGDQSDQGVA